MLRDIVRHGLELSELGLELVDDGGVAEDGAVVREIYRLRGFGEDGQTAADVLVALFEGLKGGHGGAFEVEGGGQAGPVDFEGGAFLGNRGWGKLALG